MGNHLEKTESTSNQTLNVPGPAFADYPSNSSTSSCRKYTHAHAQLHGYDSCPSASPSTSVTPRPPPAKSVQTQSSKDNSIISIKIVQIAADFWNRNINCLSFEQQLEIAVALYLGMIVKDRKIKQMLTKHFNQFDTNEKIEKTSLKFINMIGWLIRTVLRNDNNLAVMLSNLGSIHRAMCIDIKYFNCMLESLNETLSYYFPNSYKLEEKYAVNYTFTIATKMMMGENITCQNDQYYLKNLNICLKTSVGREYLFQFLKQTWCDEIRVYLKAIIKFKNQTTDKGRFMIARNIIEVSIDAKSNLNLNISYETRKNILAMMNYFENKFHEKKEFKMDSDVFQDVTHEIHQLILQNHWSQFVNKIKNMNH